MNWSIKFAFDEIQEMLDNRPWLLVDDRLVLSPSHDDFVKAQKKLYVERGWDWFKNLVRGRVFPKLNATTITRWNGERGHVDIEPEMVAEVQSNFPGLSIVSLIGKPHVVSGPDVSNDVLAAIGKVAKSQSWKQNLKTAMIKEADDDESDFSTPYLKDEFQFEIADVDRYATDKYFANLTLLETEKLYSVGFQMYNYQVGITGAVQYWHYDKDELDRARRTFNKAKKALADVMTKIEYTRPPMAVITPMVRAVLQPIDAGKKERSGNYFYNWSAELPKESDWRTTLYGPRYPDPVVQNINMSWNKDDQAKEIEVHGNSSRSRILRYKPASGGSATKYAVNLKALQKLLSDAWLIPTASAAGGVLAWLINMGIPPAQIEHQLQRGATPQEIISQATPEEPNSNTPQLDPTDLNTLDNTENQVTIDDRNLDGLDPMFAAKIRQVLVKLTEKGWRPRVAEGLRTLEQQQQKIDGGFSSLKDPRNSKHVQGKAADIIDSRYGWAGPAADLNFQFWNDLGEAAREVGLVWGGDWKTFKDVAHVEVGKNTHGSNSLPNREAFQQTDWLEAKKLVRKLISLPWNPAPDSKSVVEELIRAGIPNQLFGRLYNEVYLVERSYAFADSWSHRYVEC